MADPKSPTVTLELQWPVKFGSEEIARLTFRRPRGKDLRALRDGAVPSTADTLELIGRLSAQPKAVVDELDADDIEEAGKIIAGFRRSGQATGGGSSPS